MPFSEFEKTRILKQRLMGNGKQRKKEPKSPGILEKSENISDMRTANERRVLGEKGAYLSN
jgi:hypothetical protein